MQRYFSPIFQLSLQDVDVTDKASISLAKKKLLAEIDLSPTHTVKVGRDEMTKDDVLKAFDNIAKIDNWAYHHLIAADPVLLNFLLESRLDRGAKFAKKEEYNDEHFIEFISPYFAYSYAQRMLVCFEKRQPKLMHTLMVENPFLVTTEGADVIWNEVESYLNKRINMLYDMTEQVEKNVHFTDTEIVAFHATGMIECLNMLPKGDLDYLIDKYAMALYDFSAVSWNKKNRYRAIEVLNHASMLSVGEYERNMIQERIAFFENQMERVNNSAPVASGGEGGGMSIGTIIWIIIILIRLLLAFSR